MMSMAVCLLVASAPMAHINLWRDATHRDFQAGREYYPTRGYAVGLDLAERALRSWDIGTKWWSPAQGGLRILGKDSDLDDNGWKDVVLSDNTGSRVLRIYWNDGGSFDDVTELSTAPSECPQAFHVADLNCDGFEDLLIGCGTYSRTSLVFYGTSDPRVFSRDSIKTPYADYGAQQVVPVDINADGYLDLWITGTDEVWVLFGPDFGYREPDRVVRVPEGGYLHSQRFADVNYDGHVDVVVGQDREDGFSILYGPEFTRMQSLEGDQAWEVEVADIDGDGLLDLLASCQGADYIYWGSPDGFSALRRTSFDGYPEGLCSIADLNNDGTLDIVLCQIGHWSAGDAYVRFGPGFRTGQTLTGGSVVCADYNNDGWSDLLMWFYNPAAKLYWNRRGRFDPADCTTFPCVGDDGITTDLGNLYDRTDEERFVSRVHDVLTGSPGASAAVGDEDNDQCLNVGAYGNLPEGMRLRMQVRASLDGRHWSSWLSPVGQPPQGAVAGGAVFCLGRYYQYRLQATLDHNRTSAFVVDSVAGFVGSGAEPSAVSDVGPEPVATLTVTGGGLVASLTTTGRLAVYDASGRVCISRALGPGQHVIPLCGPRGVYVAKLAAGADVLTRKVSLKK